MSFHVTFKKLQKAIKLSMWDHKSADVSLTAILRGHAVDIFFRIASNRLVCLYRQCARRIFTPQWWNNHKRFKITILKYADWIGWKASANWTFQNSFGHKNLKYVVPERAHETFKDVEELRRNLREAWRHHLFRKWKNSSRIDATFCPQTQYTTERCKLARNIALTSGNHFAVMTGAYISPMRIVHNERLMHSSKRRYHDNFSICPACQQPADLDHHCKQAIYIDVEVSRGIHSNDAWVGQ